MRIPCLGSDAVWPADLQSLQGAVTDTAYYLEHGFLGVPGWKMQFGHGYKVHNMYVQNKKVLWGGRKELLKR